MRALVIRQPWATLLVDPTMPKWIETRSQATRVRGRVAIVAGATTRQCWEWCRHQRPQLTDPARVAGVTLGDWPHRLARRGSRSAPNVGGVPFGAVIGTVDLYGCVPIVAEAGCTDTPDYPEGMIAVAGPAPDRPPDPIVRFPDASNPYRPADVPAAPPARLHQPRRPAGRHRRTLRPVDAHRRTLV